MAFAGRHHIGRSFGLGKYPGEPSTTDELSEWYAPHVEQWSEKAKSSTLLWFWRSEIGWAETHPVLKQNGWIFAGTHIWDKGFGHVAGNSNGKTLRQFPVVTEICVRYKRKSLLKSNISGKAIPLKEWLPEEWKRSGLPLSRANEACGVKNAATRKYFTPDDNLWIFPLGDKVKQMSEYATSYGKPTNVPYFSLDGKNTFRESEWNALRHKWNHIYGKTNVWNEPHVQGKERLKVNGKIIHVNQKPLALMNLILKTSTTEKDVLWEPFGGLCSASAAGLSSNRISYAAEYNKKYFDAAVERLKKISEEIDSGNDN